MMIAFLILGNIRRAKRERPNTARKQQDAAMMSVSFIVVDCHDSFPAYLALKLPPPSPLFSQAVCETVQKKKVCNGWLQFFSGFLVDFFFLL